MLKLIYGYKGADLLPQSPFRTANGLTIQDRKKIRVAIIDDEVFERRTQLLRLGYDFKELDDIKDLKEVSNFDIALVDLMGVGLKFDSENQGAFLISEIRKNHPALFVCAYSGSDRKGPMAVYAKHSADLFIGKDEPVEELTDKLDRLAVQASSPGVIWGRIRRSLVDQGVPTRSIMQIEHEYVEEMLNKNPNSENFLKKSCQVELNETARAVIINLASSFIFKAISG